MATKNSDIPLVSIIIPTFNEEKDLPLCLNSIKDQTYSNIEVIIVDNDSNDNTVAIAKDHNIKVLKYKSRRMEARYLGLKSANGSYVLQLDADQILEKTSIERAVLLMLDNCDALCFDEYSYKPGTWVAKAVSIERRILSLQKNALDPLRGTLSARFFKKSVLIKAYDNIPYNLIQNLVNIEDYVLHYEVSKITNNIKILPDAVYHIEPDNYWGLCKAVYRYGKSSKMFRNSKYYNLYINRTSTKSSIIMDLLKTHSLGVYLIVLGRAVSYRVGYYFGY